ncbi:penicillin-binding protein 2 [Thermocrinis sp.]|uniref:penicillin-binding protein 2 n=1 Tax=Thermocrinis sp. TaxID=2024383 RepID=UPI002FDC9D38
MKRRNFILFFVLSFVLYLILVFRLFYLQVLKGNYYKDLSKRNYIRRRIIYSQRGDILDRHYKKLAYDVPEYAIFLDPKIMQEKEVVEQTLKNLREIFGIEISTQSLLDKYNSIEPVLIKKLADQSEIDAFYNNSYRLPGVFINTIPKRFYPMGEECAHIIGYVGYPTKKQLEVYKDRISHQSLVGRQGLEKALEESLQGAVGAEELIVNAVGKVVGVYKQTNPKRGNTVVLTVDSRIQKIAYEVFKESGHKAGAILILKADSGEVLALVSYPSYDPNKIYQMWDEYQKDPLNPLFNRTLQAYYPPGSVIKVGLAVGLLQQGVSIKEGVVCKGSFPLGNRVFYCWKRDGHGWVNLKTAIRDSCDVYFYHYCYYKLGPRKMESILRQFSFGESVPFELPNSSGILPNPEWKRKNKKEPWYGGDTVNMSIGQGHLKATLLQQCLMVMGIVNDGVIYRPTLIKEVRDPNGRLIWKNKKVVYKVVKAPPEYFAIVREAMRDVVRSGTGLLANSPMAEIAGKTGTAQVAAISARRKTLPYRLRDHAWFVGFYPYRNPHFIIGVLVEHGGSGGGVAAPIARRIIERIQMEGIHKEFT